MEKKVGLWGEYQRKVRYENMEEIFLDSDTRASVYPSIIFASGILQLNRESLRFWVIEAGIRQSQWSGANKSVAAVAPRHSPVLIYSQRQAEEVQKKKTQILYAI